MPLTRIKFCGITRPQDGVAAAKAGADAIGLIFSDQSSRRITVDQAREILRALPPMITPVALFVDSPVEHILEIAGALKIRTVQLHGDEEPELLGPLSGFTVIKAVRCDPVTLTASLKTWRNASALLLETAGKHVGGTGIENDWALLEPVLEDRSNLPPIIAAGGLTSENVAAVIRRLGPYAVDVSTGIEQGKGIKSVDKMNRFAAAVRQA